MKDSTKPTLFHPGVGKRRITELHGAACCGELNELERQLASGAEVNAEVNANKLG